MKNLRKLYGRSITGTNRAELKLTMTPATLERMKRTVSFGRGKDGSSFVELSVETLLSVVEGEEEQIIEVASKLNQVIDSPTALARNLRILANFIEA